MITSDVLTDGRKSWQFGCVCMATYNDTADTKDRAVAVTAHSSRGLVVLTL